MPGGRPPTMLHAQRFSGLEPLEPRLLLAGMIPTVDPLAALAARAAGVELIPVSHPQPPKVPHEALPAGGGPVVVVSGQVIGPSGAIVAGSSHIGQASPATGSNTDDAAYTSADELVYTPITISGVPANAVISSVTINWNVDSNAITDIGYYLDVYDDDGHSWSSDTYFMDETGNDPSDGYAETSVGSKTIAPPALPSNIQPDGTWYLNIWDTYDDADPSWNMGRIDSWSISIAYTVPSGPDLVGYDCYTPDAVQWGQTFTLRGKVENIGTADVTANFVQRFILSNDLVWGDTDDRVLGTYTHTPDIPAASVGPEFQVSLTLPATAPSGYGGAGPFYIGMKTDATSLVTESNEVNNAPGYRGEEWDYGVFSAMATNDLSGWTFTGPETLNWGETFAVQAQVENTGSAAVTANFVQRFYLSSNETFGDADDVVLGDSPLQTADIAAFSKGPTFDATLTLPATPPAGYSPSGTFYIGMKTDATNAVAESNEDDNAPGYYGVGFDLASFTIGNVALTLYRVSDTSGAPNSSDPGVAKTTFMPGETVRVTLQAANSSAAPSRQVTTSLTIYGPDNTTVVYDSHAAGEDNGAGSPLETGETDYYSFDWTLPAGAAPGAYDLLGTVRDAANYGTIYDTTAAGPDTTDTGPLARIREAFWRFQDTPQNRTYEDTSEYLAGRVWVNVVLPASTGSESTEDWTPQEIADVKREVTSGVTWWATTLPNAHLSFAFDWTYTDNPVSIPYEPIAMSSDDDSTWIGAVFDTIAPDTSGEYIDRMYRYNDLARRASGSDWAYTLFVVDDSNDADHQFSNGWFAYSWIGGPATVETLNNYNWGVDDMELVTAHEMGHIFYALDEYSGGDPYTARSGYFNTQNTNAVDGNPNPASIVDSMMGEPDAQMRAYPLHRSSTPSQQMTGYRDGNSNGVLDVLDTVPTLATAVLSSDSRTGTIQIQATGTIVPLSNQNPNSMSQPARAISLNTISRLQYRLDGGAWQTLASQDGAYDEHQEAGILDLAGLAPGNHHIYLRAQSSTGSWSQDGNYSSTSDTLFYVNQPPAVSSLADGPDPVVRPNSVTLTAGASDPNGSVSSVAFYRESNGTPGLQTGAGGDTALGADDSSAGGWTWTFGTGNLPPGAYTYYALATDNDGATSPVGTAAISTVNTAQDPAAENWTGGADNHWDNSANWSGGVVPGPATVAVFDGTPPASQPQLYQNATVGGLDFRTAGWTLSVGDWILTIGAGGISMAGGSSPTSRIDLGVGRLVVDYTDPAASPADTIRQWVNAGRAPDPFGTPTWTGNGITSSAAAANVGYYSVGYFQNKAPEAGGYTFWGGDPDNPADPNNVTVDETSVLVRYTWAADINLDGRVNDGDATILGALYDAGLTSGHTWQEGDLNGDGLINDADATILGALYPQGLLTLGGAPVGGSSSLGAASPMHLAASESPVRLGEARKTANFNTPQSAVLTIQDGGEAKRHPHHHRPDRHV